MGYEVWAWIVVGYLLGAAWTSRILFVVFVRDSRKSDRYSDRNEDAFLSIVFGLLWWIVLPVLAIGGIATALARLVSRSTRHK